MSRCVRTDGLLGARFNEVGLSRDQIDHAVACAECARTLAQARRFEDELRRVGMDLTPESMAYAIDAGAGPSDGMGGRTMGWPLRWAGAAAAAGAILIGAVWLGGMRNESVPPGESRGPADERVVAWADGIEETARRSQGALEPGAALEAGPQRALRYVGDSVLRGPSGQCRAGVRLGRRSRRARLAYGGRPRRDRR